MIHSGTLISRSDEFPSAAVDTDIVFLNLARGNYVALDDIGKRVWELLATPLTVGKLGDRLAEEFSGDRALIEKDLIDLIGKLRDEGMLNVENG